MSISNKLFTILGGIPSNAGNRTALKVEHSVKTVFPNVLQLSPLEPLFVWSSLAKRGVLRTLPKVETREGYVSFQFSRIDFVPMSFDRVTNLDISLKSKDGDLISIDGKLAATLIFKKIKDKDRGPHPKCSFY